MKLITKKLFGAVLGALLISVPVVANASGGGDKTESRGVITAYSDESVTVGSVVWLLDGDTEYRGLDDSPLTHADFNVGDIVKAKGENVDGNLVAEELGKESDVGGGSGDDDDDDDDNGGGGNGGGGGEIDRLIIRGAIESIDGSSIVVDSQQFVLNGDTEYQNEDGSAAVQGDFQVGDVVKVKGYPDGLGSIIAIEVEFEDDFHSGGSDDGTEKRSETVRLQCTFPQLKAIEEGVKKSAKLALAEAGFQDVKVNVKARITERDSAQRVGGAAAAAGAGIVADSTSGGSVFDLLGAIDLKPCAGVVQITVRIRGFNPLTGENINQVVDKALDITGILAGKNNSSSSHK